MTQINNLKIKHIYGEPNNCYKVVTPDGRILEEFGSYQGATDWSRRILDFLKRKKRT